MKTLIVYYSFDGNTKAAAEKISEQLSADILQLIPTKEIPRSGFIKFMKGGMKAVFGLGTKLRNYSLNPSDYDRIILGTPVWASKPTPAVNQFIKSISDKSKIAGVFTSSGGGDNDKCIQVLNNKLNNIKHTVALADKNNKEVAKSNEEKLNSFIQEMKSCEID